MFKSAALFAVLDTFLLLLAFFLSFVLSDLCYAGFSLHRKAATYREQENFMLLLKFAPWIAGVGSLLYLAIALIKPDWFL